MSPSPCYLLISSCPPAAAEELARALVERGLAACVSLTASRSVYRWRGELCREEEVTLTAKVSAEALAECAAALRALHPYELPEVISLQVSPEGSLPEYLSWVRAESRPTGA